MVRRVVGIAHVADLDSIADPDVRAAAEQRALEFGQRLLVGAHQALPDVATFEQVAQLAQAAN
jgi:5-methylthioribose kinase